MGASAKRYLTSLVFALIALLLQGVSVAAAPGARPAVPFSDPFRDGYAFLVWKDPDLEHIDAMLDRVRASGARHLLIPYFGCQSSIRSSDVGSCEVILRTSTPVLARMAKAKGFGVTFLPIVATPDWQWRGLFDPVDVPGWFASYGIWIKRLAREAKALGLTEFIVSTETTRLYRYEAQWRALLQEVRAEFEGPLILTVNWGDLEHGFWDEADAIGISAYYPLSQADNPSQQVLDAAWRARHDEFVAFSRRWKRPIHVTEVGYPSVTSAARSPWSYASGDPSDFALQARCFEAFRKAWEGDSTLVRAFAWATEVQSPASANYPFSFETLGKPAEDVLQRFFLGRSR